MFASELKRAPYPRRPVAPASCFQATAILGTAGPMCPGRGAPWTGAATCIPHADRACVRPGLGPWGYPGASSPGSSAAAPRRAAPRYPGIANGPFMQSRLLRVFTANPQGRVSRDGNEIKRPTPKLATCACPRGPVQAAYATTRRKASCALEAGMLLQQAPDTGGRG